MEPEFEEREGYLCVRLPSDTSVEQMYFNATRIAKECEVRGLSKVLLDTLSIATAPPVTDLYEAGSFCGDLFVGHLKVAAVVRAEATYPDRFFENVLQNRGVNYRWFLDVEGARRWLAQDETQQ